MADEDQPSEIDWQPTKRVCASPRSAARRRGATWTPEEVESYKQFVLTVASDASAFCQSTVFTSTRQG